MNCFNGEKYLHEAIDSVLNQTYINWELIFWDNQSTDNSANIFKSYNDVRLKYYLAPMHTDLGGGRASAWKYLTGDFIAILDVDDVWFPCKLEKQLPLFDDKEVGMVISDTLFFNEKNNKSLYEKGYPPTGWVFEHLILDYFVSLETLILRKTAIDKLPRAFDPDFSFIADFDLVVRLSQLYKLALVPEVLAKWRVHGESDTWKYPLSFIEEKERWIKKQITESPTLYKDQASIVDRFYNKNLRSKVIYTFRHQDRNTSLKLLFQTKFDHWHAWILLFLCLIPFSKFLLNIYIKNKSLSI
jgi:glycosyltransferase involved in cell wall biosynthesis